MVRLTLVLIAVVLHEATCLFNVYPDIPVVRSVRSDVDPGEPLFLSPLIKSGKIEDARNKALVPPLKGAESVVSYSGYLTVDEAFNSNMFFWFFPAEKDYVSAPVVLWLQGGPGATSLFGLFTENGPLVVKTNQVLSTRQYSWSKTHNVIYIDNPVGTGFSFTDADEGFSRNQTAVGKNLYSALVQFFKLFPELAKNEFYVTGESYAGKYVPAVSYTIHKENPTAALKINFQGMAIGNGLIDPEHMLHYGDYLYQLGLIDLNAKREFHKIEARGIAAIQRKDWEAAFEVFDSLINGDLTTGPALFQNLTGFNFYFNYLHNTDPAESDPTADFGILVQTPEVRKAIHVGNKPFSGLEANKVEKFLQQDIMKSVRPWIQELVEHYRVLIYNGQLDIIVAYPLTLGALRALDWSAKNEYMRADRHKWYVGQELAGYAKTAGKLTEVLVRNAGHMVPGDQPKWAMDLIQRFTQNKPFY
ncbi:venom serine carboxypeptidase [Cloeon dipterum]|uniref:venom serine carboxypeptidase n=1 Tax=Cloeon dipterum TaxID=197152 RepID=UPI00322097B5